MSKEGTLYKVRLNEGERCIPTKFPSQITIKANTFQVYHPSTEMRMDRIRALLDTQKTSIKEEEIIKQIQYYETKKAFSEKIIVKRAANSKRYQVLSGYAAYQAAKKLKPRHIYVMVVVDVRKEVVQHT
ncbi:hypothetical protein COL63_28105 [Bacillus pseudomycoides]|nr:hypothetical protein CON99_18845 [Bacillus pseudomycoides]PFZ05605.1 hypothetical protein COL63_28105 [Bacillus pseudomycoides]PGC48078.1 hypothetical protein COM14_12455 [Bacillus pseudomycoides]PGD23611.1 hypothetical protein COM30_27880 [Bacillus pseudomycoides]